MSVSFNVTGYYSQDTCKAGLPPVVDNSTDKLVVQDEKGEVQVINPPLLPSEVSISPLALSIEPESRPDAPNGTSAVAVVDITSLSPEQKLLFAIQNVRNLAIELYNEYPSQNLIQIRKLFTDLYIIPEGEIPKGLESLYQKKQAIIAGLKEIDNLITVVENLSLVPEEAQVDLSVLTNATNLLEIAEWAVGKGTTTYTVTPLNNVPAYQIQVSSDNNNLAVFGKLDQSPKIAPTTESTSKAEADMKKGGAAVWAVTSVYDAYDPIPEQRPFEFYIDAYGINRKMPLPGLEKLKATLSGFTGQVTNPLRIWICDFSYTVTGPASMGFSPAYCDRYIDLEQHASIFQFLKTYEQAYKDAATLLHASHPEISYNTLATFLMLNTFVELFWSQNEDPWQDHGAAAKYDAKEEDSFNETYDHYTAKTEDGGLGYIFGARVPVKDGETTKERIFPGLSWSIASSQVPVASQGLGPNAVIIGDFLKAGENEALWQKYFPGIERTEENAVQIALDPEQSIKAVAMVYDAKLTKLNQTIFNNPEVRMPDNAYPAIKDPAASREYFILSWVRYCKAFPEVEANFPTYFPYGHNSWNIDHVSSYFKLIQTVMEIPDSFPTLESNFIPSKGKPINDYFGDTKNPRNTDNLMLLFTPKE
ncbi:MAG: hypothetical protein NT099_08075 [Candidatus Saganbacteria bacterium]|nr:hypothetical protein [Candidatus Saganbacteria bacterium]